MEDQEMMSKGNKWLIGTAVFILGIFFAWLFTPAEVAYGGWPSSDDPGRDSLIFAFYCIPIILGYLVFCASLFLYKNEPFSPTKETIAGQTINSIRAPLVVAFFLMIIAVGIFTGWIRWW